MWASVWQYIADVVGRMTPAGWWMLAAGLGLCAGGMWCLRRAHGVLEASGERGSEGAPAKAVGSGGASVATWYSAVLGCLVAGYHLVAWGLPTGVVVLRVPEGYWWAVVGASVAGVAVSRALDRWV